MNLLSHVGYCFAAALLLLSHAVIASKTDGNDNLNKALAFQQENKTHFIENKGQVYNLADNAPNADVRFTLEQPGMKIFLMKTGISTQFEKYHYPEGYNELLMEPHRDKIQEERFLQLNKEIRLETWRVEMNLIGANANPQISTEGKSADYTNYYNRSVLNVHHYKKVIYHDIYPGIDWVIYTLEGGIKYDFIVHPGADPNEIRMRYSHQEGISLSNEGNVNIQTSLGTFSEMAPVSFQNGKEIKTNFKLEGHDLLFDIDSYDVKNTLIIDPLVRLWGTYYPGGEGGGNGRSCASDQNNNVYLFGDTGSSTGIASSGYQVVFGGQLDAFLVKFNPSGSRIWGSYFGSSDFEFGRDCIIDVSGNIIIAGETSSTNGIAVNGYQMSNNGGYDCYLTKFNTSGNLVWSTYYGGTNDEDDTKCSTDILGNIYLSGSTISYSGISFTGHQNTAAGGSEAFLVKFDTNGNRLWGTYYGGWNQDYGVDCATDSDNNVYLAGRTTSQQSIAINGYQNSMIGSENAFLVKFNSSGVRLWGTYYGNTGTTRGSAVCVDGAGAVYLTGWTGSATGLATGGHQNTSGGGVDGFLVKFDQNGIRLWATYYGGSDYEEVFRSIVDVNGNVYIGGRTRSYNNIAFNGFQNALNSTPDAFLVKFNSSGVRQWGSYYGGESVDYGLGLCTDLMGSAYLCGYTQSETSIGYNGYQNNLPSPGTLSAFLVKFNECSPSSNSFSQISCGSYTLNGTTYTTSGTYTQTLTNVAGCDSTITLNLTINTVPTATITPATTTTLCQGGSVVLNANTGTGLTYQWKNNGTNISGATASSYTATASGSYTVLVTNGNNCANTSAAVVVTVNALPTVNAGVDQTICLGQQIILTGSGANSYSWNNGVQNGVAFAPTGSQTYTVTGTNSTTNCTNTDQVFVTVNPLPTATITPATTTTLCQGGSVVLNANTGTGLTYQWKNNGTNISGATSSSYTATASGSYTVLVTNGNNCSNTSAAVVVTVNALPTVNAGVDQTICLGQQIILTGSGANSYSWNNGVQNGVAFAPTGSQTYTVTGTNSTTNCSNTDQVFVTVNPLPTATITPATTTTLCQGGSVVLNANTGTGLTYQWKNNGTDISGATASSYTATASGSYTVLVTNSNNCSNTSAAVVVTVNALPTVNAGVDQTICLGQQIILTGSGANSYSWNNGVQNGVAFNPSIGSTSYTVIGTDANNCSNTDQVVVTVYALPAVNAGTDQTVCEGASITLAGSGGTSYSWNNGVQDGVSFAPAVGSTTYTVTGTDANNCSNTDQIVVTVNALPSIGAGADQVICEGDAVILTGTGGVSYAWDNNVTDGTSFIPGHLGDLTYTVTGTDGNNCSNSDEVVVTVNEHTSAVQTQTALDSYTWPVNGQTYTASGTYTATIPNTAGCDSTITLNLTLNFTGISENPESAISIYPNPTNDMLNVLMPSASNENYLVIDSRGRKVLEGKLNGTETQISLKELTTGSYILQVGKERLPVRVIKQ